MIFLQRRSLKHALVFATMSYVLFPSFVFINVYLEDFIVALNNFGTSPATDYVVAKSICWPYKRSTLWCCLYITSGPSYSLSNYNKQREKNKVVTKGSDLLTHNGNVDSSKISSLSVEKAESYNLGVPAINTDESFLDHSFTNISLHIARVP